MTDKLLWRGDCMKFMPRLPTNSIPLTLTDIPYDGVNRKSNGLRTIDKDIADVVTFDIPKFLDEVWRVTNGTIIVFCGANQLSEIYTYFLGKKKYGSVRQLIWQKSNPSPMNGEHIYLNSVENAIWFKKRGGTFNARCKGSVFRHPTGSSKLHPTEKNHALLTELILDNSNEGDVVFDPCMGSGSTGVCALGLGRKFVGVELHETYFETAKKRFFQKTLDNSFS